MASDFSSHYRLFRLCNCYDDHPLRAVRAAARRRRIAFTRYHCATPLHVHTSFRPSSLINIKKKIYMYIYHTSYRIAVRTRRSVRQHARIVRLQLPARVHWPPMRDERERVRFASVQKRRVLPRRSRNVSMRVHAR